MEHQKSAVDLLIIKKLLIILAKKNKNLFLIQI